MEALLSQIKMRSWEGGPNTSIVRVIDHQSSMRMQSSDFPRLSSGNAPGADAIPAEVNKAGGLSHGRETDRVVSLYVEEEGYPSRI